MTDRFSSDPQYQETARRLRDAEEKAAYYRMLSEEAGKRSVREIDRLSHIVNEQKRTKDRLRYKVDLEILINSISTRLLKLTCNEVDSGLTWALGVIGGFLNIDRSYIFRISDNGCRMDNTHEWCAEGIESQIDRLQGMATGDFSFLIEHFENNGRLLVPRVVDLTDTGFREHLLRQSIQALAAVPMYYQDIMVGIMGFDCVRDERKWNEEDCIMMQTMSGIFVNALQRMKTEKEQQRLEEQLQIRQRMDSLGTLAGGIAHDFNNLLIAISGNLDLLCLQKDNLTQNQLKYIEVINQSTRRAASLIKEIQTLSHTTVSEKTSVDLHQIAHDVFAILDRTTDKLIGKNIAFPSDLFFVMANPDQLYHVFLNLGMNAVTAIGEKGVCPGDFIAIDAEEYTVAPNDFKELFGGEYIHIKFRDTGIGMSNEVRSRAFEPLFTTRRNSNKGQGLGLTMVYNIVTRYCDGFIEIETAINKGTTFHLYLPKSSPCKPVHVQESALTMGKDETVLVIEDEEPVRKLITEALRIHGYKVLSASDGKAGLELYSRQPASIDIVLLDITMPEMSGNVVLKNIIEINPDARIIISSGHSEEEIKKITQARAYLTKPYCISTLTETIRRIIEE